LTDDLHSTLDAIADALERCGIEFMIVGSIAALAHGRTRSTHDCDMVIDADTGQLRRFVRSLPNERFYASEEAALEALAHRSQFNVLDLASGWKIDLVLRKQRPFSATEFGRRELRTLLGRTLPVATIEDTIIAKLEWAKMAGGSARQIEDVRELLASGAQLDPAYLDRWLDELDLRDIWALTTAED
jgi:hypothetical protein